MHSILGRNFLWLQTQHGEQAHQGVIRQPRQRQFFETSIVRTRHRLFRLAHRFNLMFQS